MPLFLWALFWVCVLDQLHCFGPLSEGLFSRRLPADKQDIHNAKSAFALELPECTIDFQQEAQKGEEARSPLLP